MFCLSYGHFGAILLAPPPIFPPPVTWSDVLIMHVLCDWGGRLKSVFLPRRGWLTLIVLVEIDWNRIMWTTVHTHTHTQSSGSRPFTDSRCGVVASNPVHWRLTSLCLCSSKILSSCCCWRRPSSAFSCTSSMTPSASPWYVTPHSTAAHSGRSSLLCSPSESLLFRSRQHHDGADEDPGSKWSAAACWMLEYDPGSAVAS